MLAASLTVSGCTAASACAPIPASVTAADDLRASISEAWLTARRLWAAADGTSAAADHCEEIAFQAFGRLVALQTNEASRNAAELLLDPTLGWDAGGALLVADLVARLGGRVKPYLEPHRRTSNLAEFTLRCIEEERKTCI
jgi:hypothetical protein